MTLPQETDVSRGICAEICFRKHSVKAALFKDLRKVMPDLRRNVFCAGQDYLFLAFVNQRILSELVLYHIQTQRRNFLVRLKIYLFI